MGSLRGAGYSRLSLIIDLNETGRNVTFYNLFYG